MTNLEIKEQIDRNNKLIKEVMNPSEFTLNNTVAELLAENRRLQSMCNHNFVEGFCVYIHEGLWSVVPFFDTVFIWL